MRFAACARSSPCHVGIIADVCLRPADAVMESNFRREQKGFTRKGKILKEDSILHKIKWCVPFACARSTSFS